MRQVFENNFFSDRVFYPSLFRVLLGLLLLVDLILLLPYVDEIYRIDNYRYSLDSYFGLLVIVREYISYFYVVFISVLLLFILGIGKQITSLLVFLLFFIKFLLLAPNISYGSYILRLSLLFFVFVNSYQYFSLQKSTFNDLLSKLATLSIMLHICYIYLSNAILKILNPLWLKGDALGYFFINSKTMDIWEIGSYLLQYPYLLSLLSYISLAFQLLFPFLIWFKKTKYAFIVLGIVIHVSMAFILQLYFFEIVVILHYGFFIKDEEWQKLLPFIKIKTVNG